MKVIKKYKILSLILFLLLLVFLGLCYKKRIGIRNTIYRKLDIPLPEVQELKTAEPVGYYAQAINVQMDPDDLLYISENDNVTSNIETNIVTDESRSIISSDIDEMIQAELESGYYTWEEPLIISNPYKNSPLTGVIVFTTKEECAVNVTVKGKTPGADLTGHVDSAMMHRVPMIGLYPGEVNTVILQLLDEKGEILKEQELEVQTDPLPDALVGAVNPLITQGESAFGLTMVSGQQNSKPFAYDCNGDIRWYLDQKVGNYGIYQMSNGRLMVQDISGYTPNHEKPQTTTVYEEDLLGRYYNLYYLANGSHHEIIEKEPGGNLLCLTSSLENHYEDEIIEIDRNTGEIVNELELQDIFGKTHTNLIDWAHINTVSYQKEDDTILINCRNLHSAMKINWSTHELVWIFSHPRFWRKTQFAKYVLKPEGDLNWMFQQHTVYQLDTDLDGNPNTIEISLFDNHTQNYRKVDFYDGREGSYLKVFSIDEEKKTVSEVKEFEVLRSNITSDTIYDEISNHIFGMCGKLADDIYEGAAAMNYEIDYETGEILNQFMLPKTFYRAIPLQINLNDCASPMELPEYYIKGTLKKAVEAEEDVELPEEFVEENDVSVKILGSVLYLKAKDHTVSQVIFKGNEHTYVYDMTGIKQYKKKYQNVSVPITIPFTNLEPDEYQILCMYQDQLYRVGEGAYINIIE